MSAPIPLRRDFDAPQLRSLAKKTKDGPQARRLLALAAIYDGAMRTEAAKIGGVGLQIIREWVIWFNADGPDGLRKALEKIKEPAGNIRSQGSLGYPLRFAREMPTSDGGRRIIIATDRPISFLELRNQPRSLDYPFMLIDLRLDAQGKGQGKLIPVAKVTQSEDHVVEIENYASEPVRLTEVRELK